MKDTEDRRRKDMPPMTEDTRTEGSTPFAQEPSLWAAAPEVPWSDVRVDLVVHHEPRSQSGGKPAVGTGMDVAGARRFELMVRVRDAANGYRYTIDPEAGVLAAEVLVDGRAEDLGRGSWDPGTTGRTRVRVVHRQSLSQVWIDDIEVLAVDDPSWTVGGVALGCPAGARSRISDFAVTGADGARLAGPGTADEWPQAGEVDGHGVLELAERSFGLVPAESCATWVFLRREFTLPADATVASATLHLAAASPEPGRQFVARVSVNGTEAGLGPVRSIATEHRYESFDVTALVRPGANAIGVVAWTPEDQRVQVALEVETTSGDTHRIGTSQDASTPDRWKALPGTDAYLPLGSSGTGYYSAPREHLVSAAYPWGFDQPGFDDAGWADAVRKPVLEDLRANPAPTVHAEEHAPVTWRPAGTAGPDGSGEPAEPADGSRPTPRTGPVAQDLPVGPVVLDYGGTYVGGIVLPPVGCPADLTIRFGEMLDGDGRVRSHLATGNHFEDRWELTGDEPAPVRTWGWRVFRYVEIEGLPEGFDPSDVRALGHVYPLGERTGFRTDDPRLAEVLDLCEHTMVQANGPLLVDSWSREREPYEADAYLQAKANAALSVDTALADYGLDYLLVRRTWPTEWPFYLVLLAWEQYLRSGDRAALARRRDALTGLLPTDWIDPSTDLVRKQNGADGTSSITDHDIVDWPPTERDGYRFGPVNTVVCAIAHGAYRAMVRIEEALGNMAEAAGLAALADRLAAAMNQYLWDEQLGTFVDGLDERGAQLPHAAAHAGAFALAFDVAGEDRARRIADHLAPKGMPVSVYAAPFLLRALIRGGRVEDAYALLVAGDDRSWRGMISQGAGATMEAWNEQAKPNVSCAHPWAASPLFLVVEDLLGLRPLEPGYPVFEVAPRTDALSVTGPLGATVPTPAGVVEVDLEWADPGTPSPAQVRVVVPEGAECVLRLGDRTLRLGPGEHRQRS
jgi:alpha-L-rhamnosidase